MKCQKCGTCCRNGPPALHLCDVVLYTGGHLSKGDLLTLRKGELVWDNVRSRLVRLSEEMVRIRGCKDGSCIFFDRRNNLCARYEFRPGECQVLTCWDTRPLENMYAGHRVGRLDLIAGDSALGKIIQEHEELCPVERLLGLVEKIRKDPARNSGDLLEQLAGLVSADQAMRTFLQQKTGATGDELGFIFGRPATDLLEAVGIILSHQAGKVIIRDLKAGAGAGTGCPADPGSVLPGPGNVR